MRKHLSVVLALCGAIAFLGGCGKTETPSPAEAVLKGNHPLRKMITVDRARARAYSGLFFFSYSGTSDRMLTFSWLMNDGTYAISTLHIEEMRVVLDPKATQPSIKFRWVRSGRTPTTPTPQSLMNQNVLYAVVTVRPEDWPIDVQLPLNNPEHEE